MQCRAGAALARLASLDRVCRGGGAGLGLGCLYPGGKPLDFYLANAVFHAKIVVFIGIGLRPVMPTLRFLRWRDDGDSTTA